MMSLSETYRTLFNNYDLEKDSCFDKDYRNSRDHKNFLETVRKYLCQYESPINQKNLKETARKSRQQLHSTLPSEFIQDSFPNEINHDLLNIANALASPTQKPPGLSRSLSNIPEILKTSSSSQNPANNVSNRRSSVPVKSNNSSNSSQKSSKNSNKNNNSKRKKNKSNSKNNSSMYDKKGAGDNRKHNINQPKKY